DGRCSPSSTDRRCPAGSASCCSCSSRHHRWCTRRPAVQWRTEPDRGTARGACSFSGSITRLLGSSRRIALPQNGQGGPPVSAEEQFRVEKDSMGEVYVPAHAKWRAQTQRAVENFPISGQPIERELIAGLALIKGAGARVRAKRGLLDAAKADAIAAAA